MARGGYFIGERGTDELAAALKAAGGKTSELRAVHKRIGEMAAKNVRPNVPVYRGSKKDSKTHRGPGYLRGTVKGGASAQRSWVEMDDKSGVLILMEFGGKSYWHRGGKGALRATNRGHNAVEAFGKAVRVGLYSERGHISYTRARKPRGYFIWNVAYHLRHEIASEYAYGIKGVLNDHGLQFETAASPSLDIKPQTFGRN
ncbi:MAG TPA: hypothetical protein DCQ64_18110 [Candidatus Rokubacteria bacterium]|nr:hypothetical protein [Candidatus Rokubacteria bacterium]